MIALNENYERYQWWLNELRSLGLEVNKRNEFNDIKEISSLVDNLKRCSYLDYKNSIDYSN